jgi:FMN reductase
MSKTVLISSSLSSSSRSAKLIEATAKRLQEKGIKVQIIDLKEEDIPFCDARPLADYPDHIQDLFTQIDAADYLVFGFPIYCYSISGVLKNFLDVFSHAMKGKRFGICAAAGSKLSYLAIADLHKIMSFQSNTVGVHPAVLADYSDFEGDSPKEAIQERIDRMLEELLK